MESGAVFDPTRTYRYLLWREWDPTLPRAGFVMLNPSTADEHDNDPTIRRCINFARSWGFGGVEVANLFAFRAATPSALFASSDPVGAGNDAWFRELGGRIQMLVAAWGNDGARFGRSSAVRALLGDQIWALGVTARGEPVHPLYLRRDTVPQPWRMTVPSR